MHVIELEVRGSGDDSTVVGPTTGVTIFSCEGDDE